jgi:hypothetical protein
MKINDLRTDLDSEVNPFHDYEKKELLVSELLENDTSDILLSID